MFAHRITVVLASLLFSLHVFAATLIVGVENIDYLPYYGVTKNQYDGFMHELFDDFAKTQKIKIRYKILPIKRLFSDMVKGQLDVKIPDHPNWSEDLKRGSSIIYSNPVVNATEGILVKKDLVSTLKTEDVTHVGTVTGFTAFALLGLINEKKNNHR